MADGFTGVDAFVEFLFRLGGGAGGVGQGQAHALDEGGHGVGGVHAAAGAGAGAGVLDDGAAFIFGDGAGEGLAVALEGADHVEDFVLALDLGAAGLDGAAVDHQTGAIDAPHGHDHAGHVLVAPGEGDQRVIPLGRHDGLDAVGDDVARLQRVAHAVGAHRDAVGDADGVEAHTDEVGFLDAIVNQFGEVVEVHVAGVAFPPDRGDADLGLDHVAFFQAGGEEHGLRRSLRFGLSDTSGEFIDRHGGLLGGFLNLGPPI